MSVFMSRVGAAALLLVLLGCSAQDLSADRDGRALSEGDLQFDYFGAAPTGSIDQTVAIRNRSRTSAAAPTLSFIALDRAGRQLEDVRVRTAFGSDHGRVVAPADNEVFDVLRFEGPSADRVEDVEVSIEALRPLADSGTVYPEIEYLGADGRPVESPASAQGLRVLNAGTQDYVVRFVGIQWDEPEEGRPQQARRVIPVAEPTAVAGGSRIEVAIPADQRGMFDSLKCYITTS